MEFDDFDTQEHYEERVRDEQEYLDSLERENDMRACDFHRNDVIDGSEIKGWY